MVLSLTNRFVDCERFRGNNPRRKLGQSFGTTRGTELPAEC